MTSGLSCPPSHHYSSEHFWPACLTRLTGQRRGQMIKDTLSFRVNDAVKPVRVGESAEAQVWVIKMAAARVVVGTVTSNVIDEIDKEIIR